MIFNAICCNLQTTTIDNMDLKEAKLWDSFIAKLTGAIDLVYRFSSTTTQSQAVAELELRLEELQGHIYSLPQDSDVPDQPEKDGEDVKTPQTRRRQYSSSSDHETGLLTRDKVKTENDENTGSEHDDGGGDRNQDDKEEEAEENQLEDPSLEEEENNLDFLAEMEEEQAEVEKNEELIDESIEIIEEENEEQDTEEGIEEMDAEEIEKEQVDAAIFPGGGDKTLETKTEIEEKDDSSEPAAKKRRLTVTEKKSYAKGERRTCEQCGYCVRSVETMRRHQLRKHHTETKCPDCEHTFTVFHKYLTHVYREHKNMSHTCLECGQVFYFPIELTRHMKAKHTDRESWEHQCEECGQAFPSKNRLSVHMHSHAGDDEKIFACDQCIYRSSSNSQLKKHIYNRHLEAEDNEDDDEENNTEEEGEKVKREGARRGGKRTMYECPICGRRVKYADSLKAHMRRHRGERPYQCDICPASFASSAGLNRHKKIHGAPKHPCSECGRHFHTPGAVNRHMLVHRDAAQTCPWCPFKTTFHTNLRRHCSVHHGDIWPPIKAFNKPLIQDKEWPNDNTQGSPKKTARGPRPEYDNNKLSSGAGIVRKRSRKAKDYRAMKLAAKTEFNRRQLKVVVIGEKGDVVSQQQQHPVQLDLMKNIIVTKATPNNPRSNSEKNRASNNSSLSHSLGRSHIQVKVISEGSKENSMQLQMVHEEEIEDGEHQLVLLEDGAGAGADGEGGSDNNTLQHYQIVTQYPEDGSGEIQYQFHQDNVVSDATTTMTTTMMTPTKQGDEYIIQEQQGADVYTIHHQGQHEQQGQYEIIQEELPLQYQNEDAVTVNNPQYQIEDSVIVNTQQYQDKNGVTVNINNSQYQIEDSVTVNDQQYQEDGVVVNNQQYQIEDGVVVNNPQYQVLEGLEDGAFHVVSNEELQMLEAGQGQHYEIVHSGVEEGQQFVYTTTTGEEEEEEEASVGAEQIIYTDTTS